MKLKTTIIGFALALAACSNEGPDLSEQQLRAVGFGSYTEQFQTRGSDVQRAIPDGGSMGVYAYYHDGSTWADDADALSLDASANKLMPDFMWNQQCTYSADLDAFVYTPLKYWPNEESDKLSFIAYYPYTAENPGNPESPAYPENPSGLQTLLTNSGKGLPSFNFTVKDNAADQVDLLVSDLIVDLPQTRDTEDDPGTPFNDLSIYDKVKFLFHHALAKVEFRIVADADIRKDIVKFRLSKLEITHIKKTGTLTTSYDAGTSATSLSWSGQSNEHPYAFKTYVPQLLMPQTLVAAKLDLNYSITFKSDGTTYHYYGSQEGEGGTVTGTLVADEHYTYSNTASIQLNKMKLTGTNEALTKWLPNHHYIYTIRLRANRIEFTGEVVDWGDKPTADIIEVKE